MTTEFIVSVVDNLKTMLEVIVHEKQAILLMTVVISHTFCTENKKELTPRGV